jgi:hypothetical protein
LKENPKKILKMALTDEQKKRIEENRLKAIAKRQSQANSAPITSKPIPTVVSTILVNLKFFKIAFNFLS